MSSIDSLDTLDQLTQYLSELKNESELHLASLEEVIKKGDQAEFDTSLQEKQLEINKKIGFLISSVEGNSTLLQELHTKNTEFSVFYNNLKSGYEGGNYAANFQKAEQQNQENMNRKDRIKSFSKDNKRAIGAGVAGAGWGFVSGYNESTQNMEQSSRGGKRWKRLKGVCNGLRKGTLYGAGALLGVKGVGIAIEARDGIKKTAEFVTSPSQRYEAAKNGIKHIIDNVSGWLGSFGIKSHDEQFDAANAEVAEQRMDGGVYEIQMEGIDKVKILNRKNKQEEVVLIPEAVEIPEALIPSQLDVQYQDNDFTDRYLLTVKSLNLRTSCARKRVQESGWFTKQGSYFNDVFLLEQDILKLQQMVLEKKSKADIETYMQGLLNRVSEFEANKQSVIGPTDWEPVLGFIKNHKAQGGENQLERMKSRDRTEASIYNQYRSTGGYGNSNTVAESMFDDVCKKDKYINLLNFFDEPDIWSILEGISPDAEFDEGLMSKLGVHFQKYGFRGENGKLGLGSPQEREICEQLISAYHETKKTSEAPETLQQVKIHFNRNFGGDIDTNTDAQQRMIQSYESNPEMLQHIKDFTKDQSYPGSMAIDDPKRFEIIKNFARTSAKQQIVYGAVQSAFLNTFFDQYLPTQKKVVGTKETGSAKEGYENENIYEYTDPKEKLLASIIGAGPEVSDDTVKTAVDWGVNIAISLIPVLGAEFAIAKTIGTLGARFALVRSAGLIGRTARLALRVAVGHSVMSIGQGLLSNESCYEIFDNLTSRTEFTKNALFFTVIGKLAPWLKSKGQFLRGIEPSSRIGKALLPIMSSEAFISIGALSIEAAVITGGTSILDENHDRSRGEFMTVCMLSLVLQSKTGKDMRNYKAIVEKGKVKIIPRNIGRIAQGIETGVSKNSMSLRTRYRNTLKNLEEGQEVTLNGKVFKKESGKIISEGTTFQTIEQALSHCNISKLNPEKLSKLWAEELGVSIEKRISNKEILKIGEKEFQFQVENGTVNLLQKTNGKRIKASEQELQQIIQQNEKVLVEKLGKKASNIGQTPVSNIPEPNQSRLRKQAEFLGIKGRDFFLGDLYPVLKGGKIDILKIAKGNLSLGPGMKSLWQLFTGRIGKSLWTSANNLQSTFTVASIIYGLAGGDDGDAGFDEGLENYVMYHVLGRSIPLKILAYVIDEEVL